MKSFNFLTIIKRKSQKEVSLMCIVGQSVLFRKLFPFKKQRLQKGWRWYSFDHVGKNVSAMFFKVIFGALNQLNAVSKLYTNALNMNINAQCIPRLRQKTLKTKPCSEPRLHSGQIRDNPPGIELYLHNFNCGKQSDWQNLTLCDQFRLLFLQDVDSYTSYRKIQPV